MIINHFNPVDCDDIGNILPSGEFLNFFNINIIVLICLRTGTLKF